ncbi:energy transducer TonB [Pontibacter sp. G13]|uniref:energy transducer TonB n=1 Tax=Pontibacter sp. G13 TaxID=3074898 RepID=UPI00288AC4A2|nr:energy transducer TonB [Pontibacter sp. G13]WNJ18935.1 energy transducer TonB [Pontibacter sp. G13]
MPDKRRNFWILLTLFALLFTGAKWLDGKQRQHKAKCLSYASKYACASHLKKRAHHRDYKRKCRKRMAIHTPAIDEILYVQKEPIPLNKARIQRKIGYPTYLRDAGIEGAVVARILVDEHGNYLRHQVVSQSHPCLRRRCEKYLHQLQFTPALKDGRPIRYWVNVPFLFGE